MSTVCLACCSCCIACLVQPAGALLYQLHQCSSGCLEKLWLPGIWYTCPTCWKWCRVNWQLMLETLICPCLCSTPSGGVIPSDSKCILGSPLPVGMLICSGAGWIWIRWFMMFCATITERFSSCACISSKAALSGYSSWLEEPAWLLPSVLTLSLLVLLSDMAQRVRVPRRVATATIRGWRLFHSELVIVRLLFEGGIYLKKYSIHENTL